MSDRIGRLKRAGITVEKTNGPLGVMFTVCRDGKNQSSHGGGTEKDARDRAFRSAHELATEILNQATQ